MSPNRKKKNPCKYFLHKMVKTKILVKGASRQFSTPVFYYSYYNLKPRVGNLKVELQEVTTEKSALH